MLYHDLKELRLLEEIRDIDLNPLAVQIDNLRQGSYWESKNERLLFLKDSQTIAVELAMATIGFRFTIQELVAILANKLSNNCTYEQCLHNAIDVIEACDGLIYEIKTHPDIQVNSLYDLEDDTYDFLALENYRPPMKVQPTEWVGNSTTDYYDSNIHCILGNSVSQHQGPQALDALNLLQEISWELNPEIMALEELPSTDIANNPDAMSQFTQLANRSRELYESYKDNPFWFIWRFDKRGRMYSTGYEINLQASGYKKALLDFAVKEVITD